MQRYVRLFDVLRRDPSKEVMRRAGLVVGTGHSSTTKRLLANNGSGTFVVDIQIAGRVLQTINGLLEEFPVNKSVR